MVKENLDSFWHLLLFSRLLTHLIQSPICSPGFRRLITHCLDFLDDDSFVGVLETFFRASAVFAELGGVHSTERASVSFGVSTVPSRELNASKRFVRHPSLVHLKDVYLHEFPPDFEGYVSL